MVQFGVFMTKKFALTSSCSCRLVLGKLSCPKSVQDNLYSPPLLPLIWIMSKRREMIFSRENFPNANQERFWSYCCNLTLFVNVVKH